MQVSKVDKKNLNEPQVTNTFRIMLEVTNFFTSKITEENVDLIISVYDVIDYFYFMYFKQIIHTLWHHAFVS